jgi:hypothetical protein
MKFKNIIHILLLVLIVTTFFFKVIPVPLESIDGYTDKEHFIYGGMYYTSILNELSLGNNVSLILPLICLAILLIYKE